MGALYRVIVASCDHAKDATARMGLRMPAGSDRSTHTQQVRRNWRDFKLRYLSALITEVRIMHRPVPRAD